MHKVKLNNKKWNQSMINKMYEYIHENYTLFK